MKVLKNINVLKKAISAISDLGFVPTMGGLHKGHISLIKESQKKCKKTLVSIYVNPKQFDNKNDFSKYPRNINKDLKLLKTLKIDYLFLPTTNGIYKSNNNKDIKLLKAEKILCARFRKGHFEGVLNIMNRFIDLIKPRYIFLGEKDFQQLILIKNFIKGKYKSKIYPCKTIRNKNNAPLSSRNFLLTKKSLRKVELISTILKRTKPLINKSYLLNNYLKVLKEKLINKFNIKIEYLEIRNVVNFKEYVIKNKTRIFIAYYINDIRLIDNI